MPLHGRIQICHLTSVHRAYDTRIFYKECRSLAQVYQVSLIAPAARSELKEGVQIIALRPYKSRLLRFLLTDTLLLLKALLLNATVYHLHDPELLPHGLLLKLLGKKVIYDVHENVHADLAEKSWLPAKGLFQAFYRLCEKMAFSSMHFVLAEKSYEAFYKNKAKHYTIVQNFAPLELLAPLKVNIHKVSHKVLMVGMLSARRGMDKLIEAVYLLKERGIRIEAVCVGPLNDALQQILDASPYYQDVKEQFIFTGTKSLPDAYVYAAECFAGIALPEDLPNHRKSYPTKMFEYMAVGLPVICSNFPLYKEIIEQYDCGLTVNPASATALAEAMERLYTDKNLAAIQGRNAAEAARHFDWRKEEKKLLTFYREILS